MSRTGLSGARSLIVFVMVGALSATGAGFSATIAEAQTQQETRPDWIPAGTVSPALERRALQTQVWLQQRAPAAHETALRLIAEDIERFEATEMRTAAAPLLVDLLGHEYRILETPENFTVAAPTRIAALDLLARIGGRVAREQIRYSVRADVDAAVRSGAVRLLVRTPGDEPERDLDTVGRALLATLSRNPLQAESEIRTILAVLPVLIDRVWMVESQALFEGLIGVAGGPYSSSSRNTAMSLLEDLAAR